MANRLHTLALRQRSNRARADRKVERPTGPLPGLFTGDYDHVAHLTADRAAQLHAIEGIDSLVGRVWGAIQQSPLGSTTVLALISDHGMNTEEGVYSHGYN